LVFSAETPHRHRAVGGLLGADDKNYRDFGDAVFTDLVIDLFVADI